MKYFLSITFTLFLIITLLSNICYAQHDEKKCKSRSSHISKNISLSFESDFLSKYLYRGIPASRGFVWQPSATIEAYGAGLTIWGNFVLNDEPNQGEFNEVDFIPYYTKTWGNFTFNPSILFAIYPNDNPASLNYTAETSVRPEINVSYAIGDFDIFADGSVYVHPENNGSYWFIGSGFHKKLFCHVRLDTSILFTIADKYYNRSHVADVGTKINAFEYLLTISINPIDNLTFVPYFHMSILLPPSIRNAVANPNQYVGGIEIKYDL